MTNKCVVCGQMGKPGDCLPFYRSTSAMVYLGFREYPLYISHHSEPNVQILSSSNIIVHEDFANVNNQYYLNNIALVKLSKPITLSDKVRPGKLISRQESYLLEGKYADISGWKLSSDESKKLATVQIRNRDTCTYLFGNRFLRSQEFCVKWLTKTRLNLVGNPVRIDGDIIGFQTYTPPCTVATSSCTQNDMVLNLLPFLDWMSHKMDIPIEKFTNKKHESCDYNEKLKKTEDLVKKIDKALNKGLSDLEKYKDDIDNLNKEIKNILAQLNSTKTEQNNFALSLNEQIKAIATQINNNKIQIDQNVFNIQEELNSMRTVVSGGLTAQQSLNDLEAKFLDLNNTVEVKVNNQTDKLEEQIKELANKINDNSIEKRVLEQKERITDLYGKLDAIKITQEKNLHALDEQFGFINTTITGISSEQFHSKIKLHDFEHEFKIHLLHEEKSLNKLQERLDDIFKIEEDSTKEGKARFDEIENVFDKQRLHMDQHIIQEFTQLHSLRTEIELMNVTLNKIKSFIYDEPLSS